MKQLSLFRQVLALLVLMGMVPVSLAENLQLAEQNISYTTTPLAPITTKPPTDTTLSGLQSALILYQNAATHPWPAIELEGLLKLGSKDENVKLVRERLKLI